MCVCVSTEATDQHFNLSASAHPRSELGTDLPKREAPVRCALKRDRGPARRVPAQQHSTTGTSTAGTGTQIEFSLRHACALGASAPQRFLGPQDLLGHSSWAS